MEPLVLYFSNHTLKIFAKVDELLKSNSKFVIVESAEKEEIIINLDQILWISKETDEPSEY